MSKQLVVTKYVAFSGEMLEFGKDDPGWAKHMQQLVARTAGDSIAELLLEGALDQTMPVKFDIHEASEASTSFRHREEHDQRVWNPYLMGDRTVEVQITYWDKRDPYELAALVEQSQAHPAQVARRPVNELERFSDHILDRYR